MSKLLITGATGFIGGKLAEYYLRAGADLRLLIRGDSSHLRVLTDFLKAESRISKELCGPNAASRHLRILKDNCEIAHGDVTSPDSLRAAVAGVDEVIHCAGMLGKWGTPYQKLYEVNVRGTENLILAAFQAGVKRFIHLSAGGVTGPLGLDPADETYHSQPRTDYERSKWEAEKLALRLATERNLNLLVVRPTFTYGPGDPHKLPLFRAVKKNRIAFIGSGLSTIHPVYIDDLISGINLALKSDPQGSLSDLRAESVILGGERPVSKCELIWGIADVLGVRRPELKLPVWAGEFLAWGCEALAGVFGFEPPLTQSRVLMMRGNWGYSIAKAQKLLGYQPQIGLQDGLRRTALWYQEHGWL